MKDENKSELKVMKLDELFKDLVAKKEVTPSHEDQIQEAAMVVLRGRGMVDVVKEVTKEDTAKEEIKPAKKEKESKKEYVEVTYKLAPKTIVKTEGNKYIFNGYDHLNHMDTKIKIEVKQGFFNATDLTDTLSQGMSK